MEHRFCKRRSAKIPSKIYIRDEFSGNGNITNISFDGAYVNYVGADQVESDSVIRIEFSLPVEGKESGMMMRMPALVVHQARGGFGVMFIYGPSPFCKTPLTDVRINHCSHISGLLMEAFYFLAPMVICAHPPHHPSGFFTANARTRF